MNKLNAESQPQPASAHDHFTGHIVSSRLCLLGISLIASDLAEPRIEVFKAARELRLFDGAQLIKIYCVALGTIYP